MFMESVASLALSFISLSFSLFLYVSLTLSPAREAMANTKEGEEPDFVPFIRWKRFGKPKTSILAVFSNKNRRPKSMMSWKGPRNHQEDEKSGHQRI